MSALRKVNVTFSYDDEKLSAIKMYMEQKELNFSEELVKAVEGMYSKYVPLTVRDFIDMREKISQVLNLRYQRQKVRLVLEKSKLGNRN